MIRPFATISEIDVPMAEPTAPYFWHSHIDSPRLIKAIKAYTMLLNWCLFSALCISIPKLCISAMDAGNIKSKATKYAFSNPSPTQK